MLNIPCPSKLAKLRSSRLIVQLQEIIFDAERQGNITADGLEGMATALQLWLSSRPARTTTAQDSVIHGPDNSTDIEFRLEDGIYYTTELHKASHSFCQGDSVSPNLTTLE
jgi:hypothetical protein